MQMKKHKVSKNENKLQPVLSPAWTGVVGLPVKVVYFCVTGFHTALNSDANSRSFIRSLEAAHYNVRRLLSSGW
jgi:hypothetical protein